MAAMVAVHRGWGGALCRQNQERNNERLTTTSAHGARQGKARTGAAATAAVARMHETTPTPKPTRACQEICMPPDSVVVAVGGTIEQAAHAHTRHLLR